MLGNTSVDTRHFAMPDNESDTFGRTVLFLDFDGVLQTPALPDWVEMEHCDELIRLVDFLKDIEIVITSTHREGRDCAAVARLLPKCLSDKVTSVTVVSANGRARGGRQLEIQEWLRHHPGVVRWVAVDDEPELFFPGCPWVVFTHPWVGWQSATTEEVCRVLKRQTPICRDVAAPSKEHTATSPHQPIKHTIIHGLIETKNSFCRPVMHSLSTWTRKLWPR